MGSAWASSAAANSFTLFMSMKSTAGTAGGYTSRAPGTLQARSGGSRDACGGG